MEVLQMIDINHVSLLNLLPANLCEDPNVVAAAKAIDGELHSLNEEIRRLSIFDRVNDWSDDEVNELAWQFHVDFYDPLLPLDQRRQLVHNSIRWHRRKGTPSAVEELIQTLFGSGKVEEWWEYGGQQFHFQVTTDDPEATNEKAGQFYLAIDSVKRLSTVLDRVIITQSEELSLYFGGVLHTGETITIGG